MAMAAAGGAEHEAGGERDDVEDHHVLQCPRVEELQHEVAGGNAGEARAQRVRRCQRCQREDDCGADGERRGDHASGNRARALDRMQAIVVAVGDVVDEVDDARQRAEHDERADRVGDGGRVEERRGLAALAEKQRAEHEEVLRPLRGAQRHEEAERGRPIGLSLVRDG